MAQPLSPNEIRDRALKFAREWEGVTSEKVEAQTFWNEFFEVFGRRRRGLAEFEESVHRARERWEMSGRGQSGFIDLFWKGTLIAEHKSAGKDLDTAYEQALGYFDGLYSNAHLGSVLHCLGKYVDDTKKCQFPGY